MHIEYIRFEPFERILKFKVCTQSRGLNQLEYECIIGRRPDADKNRVQSLGEREARIERKTQHELIATLMAKTTQLTGELNPDSYQAEVEFRLIPSQEAASLALLKLLKHHFIKAGITEEVWEKFISDVNKITQPEAALAQQFPDVHLAIIAANANAKITWRDFDKSVQQQYGHLTLQQQKIMALVKAGNVTELKKQNFQLEWIWSRDYEDSQGRTIAYWARKIKNEALDEYLSDLINKYRVYTLGKYTKGNFTAMHMIVLLGKAEDQPSIAERMTYFNTRTMYDAYTTTYTGFVTPLHFAAYEGRDIHLTEILKNLKYPYEINEQTHDGYTALMFAVKNGHLNCVTALCADKRVDLNVALNDGTTAASLVLNVNYRYPAVKKALLTALCPNRIGKLEYLHNLKQQVNDPKWAALGTGYLFKKITPRHIEQLQEILANFNITSDVEVIDSVFEDVRDFLKPITSKKYFTFRANVVNDFYIQQKSRAASLETQEPMLQRMMLESNRP